jgi:catechol 2,3-dioxygenase-like lactoylglutathione lyase family enzyme
MSVRHVRHAGIVVSDAEHSLSFYRDLLGLRVEADQLESGNFIENVIGIEEVTVRTVKLAAPQGPTLIELLEFGGAPGSPLHVGDLRRLGPTHIALTVDSLDEIYERLRAQGVGFLSAPQTSPDGRVRVAFCADPDGAMLELVESLSC